MKLLVISGAGFIGSGQIKKEEKTNEIAATPELLNLLNLQACLATIDAMGCQKKIASQILQHGADYLLSMKENQPALTGAFEAAFPMTKVVDLEKNAYVTDEKN